MGNGNVEGPYFGPVAPNWGRFAYSSNLDFANGVYNAVKAGDKNKALQILYAAQKSGNSCAVTDDIIRTASNIASREGDGESKKKINGLKEELKDKKEKGFPAGEKINEKITRGLSALYNETKDSYGIFLCAPANCNYPTIDEVVNSPDLIILYKSEKGDDYYQIGDNKPRRINCKKETPFESVNYLGTENIIPKRSANYYQAEYRENEKGKPYFMIK